MSPVLRILPPCLSLEAGGPRHTHLFPSSELPGPCPSPKPGLETPSVPFQVREVLGRAGGASWVPGLCFPLSPRRQSRVAAGAAGGLISSSQHFPQRACGSRRATNFQRQGRGWGGGGENRGWANRKALSLCARNAPAASRRPPHCNRAAAGISRRFRPGGRRPLHLFLRGRRRVGSGRRASGSRRP